MPSGLMSAKIKKLSAENTTKNLFSRKHSNLKAIVKWMTAVGTIMIASAIKPIPMFETSNTNVSMNINQ